MATRTRFAPSPTGEIHVGNARTALFAVLLAVRDSGAFLLRIEDTDASRSQLTYEESMRADLAWLGIHWQEGPDVGGPKGPYRQSERTQIYDDNLKRLAEMGLVYPCFCTPLELEVSRKAQISAGKPPRYAGTCAKLSTDEIEARLAKGLKPALRFRVPERGETVFMDMVRGRQVFAHHDIGDFIVRRADGSPAFFFSNAVDDALMGVTHVLRGEDHLANTPRQLLILEALNLTAPQYAHLSLIVGHGGAPLSKREGGGSLRELRTEGVLPEALLNYLARLGHASADNSFLDLAGLARNFDVAHLGHSPAHFDHTQLDHWQGEAVRHAGSERLWDWMSVGHPGLARQVPESKRLEFVGAVRGNVTRPSQAAEWAAVIYGELPPLGSEAETALREAGTAFFEAVLGVLRQAAPEFKPFANAVGVATGLSGKALYQPLRAALTGRLDGPEMERLWKLMGSKLVEARFTHALDGA